MKPLPKKWLERYYKNECDPKNKWLGAWRLMRTFNHFKSIGGELNDAV